MDAAPSWRKKVFLENGKLLDIAFLCYACMHMHAAFLTTSAVEPGQLSESEYGFQTKTGNFRVFYPVPDDDAKFVIVNFTAFS